jgi:replicative DNA helicase
MQADAHAALLSQMVKDRDVYFQANVPGEAFPQGKLRQIYRAIRDRYEAGSDVDLVLLHEDLPELPASELTAVLDTVPSSANWRYYLDEVHREWRRRQVRALGLELQDRAEDEDAVDFAYAALSKLEDMAQSELHSAREAAIEFIAAVEERYHNRGRLPGIPTGLPGLDNILLGLKARTLYYIGARPGGGKTALLTTIARNACARGVSVGFLSLESSRREIMARLYSNVAGIDNQRLVTGSFGRPEFEKLNAAGEQIHGWRLVLADRENMPLSAVRARAREMVRAGGVQLLLLDYVQLVRPDKRMDSFRLHMGDVSMALKQLARELEVPVVAAAQLGRSAEDRAPTMADLKESGQLEQDADAVILIHHDEDEGSRLIVAKHRDGPRGAVRVMFSRSHMRFVDAAHASEGVN